VVQGHLPIVFGLLLLCFYQCGKFYTKAFATVSSKPKR